MYSAMEIARYIINYSNEKDYPISNLRLQKLLYFIQASFYKFKDIPCFSDDIYCWDYGPVVPSVYRKFKGNGSLSIPEERDIVFDRKSSSFVFVKFELKYQSEEDKKIVDDNIEFAKKLTVFDLVEITHKQKPWLTHYRVGQSNVIPKEDIRNYFRGI